MRTFICIAALLNTTMAAPGAPLDARQTQSSIPRLTDITYRVSNLEDPNNVRFVNAKLKINGGAINFDGSNGLVGACKSRLNDDGHVRATRIDILTTLKAVHCNLYNGEKHVICKFSNQAQGYDFDGVEGSDEVVNKAVNANKYSLLCYYV